VSFQPERQSRTARHGGADRIAAVKVLALDYGSARTGVAVSDASGAIARPLGVVARAATEQGMERLLALLRDEEPERIVVGLPLTLRGERGAQAHETEAFVERLRAAVEIPVDTFDERLTTVLAARTPSRSPEDALAAAHLLEGYLAWLSRHED
jgi:putative Holliday junction resolvase